MYRATIGFGGVCSQAECVCRLRWCVDFPILGTGSRRRILLDLIELRWTLSVLQSFAFCITSTPTSNFRLLIPRRICRFQEAWYRDWILRGLHVSLFAIALRLSIHFLSGLLTLCLRRRVEEFI